ncbi:hypothetical protein AAC387_Pa01g1733 [Persea americana]
MGAVGGEKNDGAGQTVMQGGDRGESIPGGCCGAACRWRSVVRKGKEEVLGVADGLCAGRWSEVMEEERGYAAGGCSSETRQKKIGEKRKRIKRKKKRKEREGRRCAGGWGCRGKRGRGRKERKKRRWVALTWRWVLQVDRRMMAQDRQ